MGTETAGARSRGEQIAAFVGVLLQVALVHVVIRQFKLEGQGLRLVTLVALLGLPLYALAPPSAKLWLFLALSLIALDLVLGPSASLWLVALGLGLIGICHLPIPIRWRVALLVAAGAALTWLCASHVPVPWPASVWPILASMFAFRLFVYVYTLRHDQTPVPWNKRLAYFFLLPNVCLPLFPVVDFQTFRRTYRDADLLPVAQRGALSMWRGLSHLLLYRFVYHVVVISPDDVHNVIDLTRYLVANFALYLRVSGLFHLAIGMLQLYGFDLPPTHQHYFLAAGINDFWRRVNIYWKDFMLKVFFYPAYFRLRRLGETPGLILSTVMVVFVTWALHAYQQFWIAGVFPLAWQDAAFWGILGVFMVIAGVYEQQRTRLRGLRRRVWTARNTVAQALLIVLTFGGMSVLWSVWTCGSLDEWKGMMKNGARIDAVAVQQITIALWVAAIALAATVALQRLGAGDAWHRISARLSGTSLDGWRGAGARVLSLLVLLFVTRPAFYLSYGGDVTALLYSVRNEKMNTADTRNMRQGYYEKLLNGQRPGSRLAEIQARKPPDWDANQPKRSTDAPLNFELIPLLKNTRFHEARLSTNRWGMRDRDYEVEKPPGVLRIAILGPSISMGVGVSDDETFEGLIETRLQSEGMKVEILNFSVLGYSAFQTMIHFETLALRFQPDIVVYFTHDLENGLFVRTMLEANGRPMKYEFPEIRALMEKAGLKGGLSNQELRRRIIPYAPEGVTWSLKRIVADCRERGIATIGVYLPTLEETLQTLDTGPILAQVQNAGFKVIDLSDVFEDRDIDELMVRPWDGHPNGAANRIVAERLYNELMPTIGPLYTEKTKSTEHTENTERTESTENAELVRRGNGNDPE